MIRYQPVYSQIPRTSVRQVRDCMVARLRELAGTGEGVTREDLLNQGFNAAAIDRFGKDAAVIARRQSTRYA